MTISEFKDIVSLACLVISMIGGLGAIIYLFRGIIKYLKRKNDLNQYEISIAYDTDSLEEQLDAMILDCLTTYTLLNIGYRDDVTYINDQLEATIRDEVTKRVSDHLTDVMLDKLSLLYRSSAITDIIAQKIYLAVMNYRIQFNAGKMPTPNESTKS